ncbi:MAG: hypothetical protein G01um1014107_160 [Parcubacteria group bacterium Gr01-1014_107]|nr:MAG: hypothetical protein G01um1014107_160 [Parcubacteria group bacterium Gr01-1014_107]
MFGKFFFLVAGVFFLGASFAFSCFFLWNPPESISQPAGYIWFHRFFFGGGILASLFTALLAFSRSSPKMATLMSPSAQVHRLVAFRDSPGNELSPLGFTVTTGVVLADIFFTLLTVLAGAAALQGLSRTHEELHNIVMPITVSLFGVMTVAALTSMGWCDVWLCRLFQTPPSASAPIIHNSH